MEIERKFLLNEPPDLSNVKTVKSERYIEQYYVASTLDQELRVRTIVSYGGDYTYTMTFKSGHGTVRTEKEHEISNALFYRLANKCRNTRIRKRRVVVEHGGVDIEIDYYEGDDFNRFDGYSFDGLCIAEIEFETLDEANAYDDMPSWMNIAKEVTNDERYKNRSLSLYGVPPVDDDRA